MRLIKILCSALASQCVFFFLRWIGITCKVFNVGAYRRQATHEYNDHHFFLNTNEQVHVIHLFVVL